MTQGTQASETASNAPDTELASTNVAGQLLVLAFRNQRSTLAMNLIVTVVVAWFLRSMSVTYLAIWVGLTVTLSSWRAWSGERFLRQYSTQTPPPGSEIAAWHRRLSGGFLSGGVMWAVAMAIALPASEPELQFALLLIIAALATGASSVLAPLRYVAHLYIGIMLVPACLQLVLLPDMHGLMGLLGLAYLGVLISATSNNYELIERTLKLQGENTQLVACLQSENELKEQLNQELEHRVYQRTAELRRLISHDTLTGLYNRQGLHDWLEQNLHPNVAPHYAIIFVDLDRFKQINEALGHDIGDRALTELSRRFQEILPPGAAIARWGGDEFIAIVPCGSDSAAAEAQGMSIAQTFQACTEAALPLGEQSVQVGLSVGVALYPRDGQTAEELIRAAGLSTTHVKRTQRGQIHLYEHTLAYTQQRRLHISLALKRSLQEGLLWLEYQPIVATADGKVESLEALVRWNHPDLGRIGPDEFIPIAEETDQILELGAWVLLSACREAASWGVDPSLPAVSVNVSLRQLVSPQFLGTVMAALTESSLPAGRLEIEVTESVFDQQNAAITLKTLQALHEMGIRIYLDDFGTGYSSLSRLHEFPLDVIKIDRSFVNNIEQHGATIIQGAVMIARSFNLRVVAEGVETVSQAKRLSAMGVDLLQGYGLARPSAEARLTPFRTVWLRDQQQHQGS